ncbi:MAG: phosphomannomutase [Pseudomonadota bacterium]
MKGPKFGTSGLRGLVTDLSDALVARYAAGFADYLQHRGRVLIGRDLRESSPRIARAVAAGLRAAGAVPVDCGALPTPALAFESARRAHPAIMVTGSHIPADRNGLKFYTAQGEISKDDETGIQFACAARGAAWLDGETSVEDDALAAFRARYTTAFTGLPLTGMRIGVYQHSSVARDLLVDILSDLGAHVMPLGRSEKFVPVDTEAVSPKAAALLQSWAQGFDAIVSTDGDADRPMVADENGRVIPGDVLGPLTAREIGAKTIVTPVSSNSLVEKMGAFDRVVRTRIGSPFVIAAMKAEGAHAVAGYEANGGFLLGFATSGLAPLMTRDCVLPIIVPLIASARRGLSLSALRETLPPIFTASDRLQDVDPERSKSLIAGLSPGSDLAGQVFAGFGKETARDMTDGLRVTFEKSLVVHIRPSGNAPELRCYAEAQSQDAATALVARTLAGLRQKLSG